MRMKGFFSLLLMFLAVFAEAHAQVYVHAHAGQSKFGLVCYSNTDCDFKDIAFKAGAGYMFNRHIGIEAGYWRFGEAVLTTKTGLFEQVTSEAESIGLLLVGVLPIDRFSVYGKLGPMYTKYREATRSDLPANYSRELTSVRLGYVAGASYEIVPGWKAQLEFSRTQMDLSAYRPYFDMVTVGAQFTF
jgi:opacity protein-like surface antigen